MKFKVLITGKLHDMAMRQFEEHPKMEVNYVPDCSAQKALELIPDYHVIVSRSETNVDRALIEKGKNLKVIARAAVGVGNIDIPFATEKGILVINCPGKNTNSAAELAMGLMISLMRKLASANAKLKAGGWDRHTFSGFELRGKKLGLIGLGNVGHRVAKFANGFDMEVFGYDPYISPTLFDRYQVKKVDDLKILAATCDIISFHVPLTHETKDMVNQSLFKAMKKGAYFINASRGEIVAEPDLLVALQNGTLAGAAIDTWKNEPKPWPELLQHERVIGSPHIGASTEEAQLAIGQTIFEQVVKAISGGVVDYPVNLPEVGVIDQPLLKSYAVLSEKLGSLAGQLLEFNPQKVVLHYRGELADIDSTLVRLAWLKGFLSHVVDEYVSFVNCKSLPEKLGLQIAEIKDGKFSSYNSALKVELFGASGQQLVIGGTVFDQDKIRLSRINDFNFELEPNGTFVLVENLDRVGVVGRVGTFLAENSINIDSFNLSRDKKGGNAMSLIRTDSEVSTAAIDKMHKLEHLLKVKQFVL